MTWHLYLLRCRGGSLYAGITNNLPRRLEAHLAGRGAKYTRSRLPVQLVWSREMATEREARQEEYRLKQRSHAEKLALVRDDPLAKP
jgi:putative endonuclease